MGDTGGVQLRFGPALREAAAQLRMMLPLASGPEKGGSWGVEMGCLRGAP